MNVAEHLHTALRVCHPSRALCHGLDQHALARRFVRLEREEGVVFEPRLRETTTYLPFAAARPVAPHVAGPRRGSWQGSAMWGAALTLSALRHDVPLLAGWVGAELLLTAEPADFQPAAWRETEGGPETKLAQARRLAGAALLSVALGVGATLCGELLVGSGQRREGNAALELAFTHLRRVGMLGLLQARMLSAAEHARDEGKTLREAALLGAALGVQLAIEALRVGIIVPVALAAAGIGVGIGLSSEVFSRARFLLAQRRFAAEHPGRAPEVLSLAEAEELERAHMFGVNLGELNDERIAGPLLGVLWETLHQENIEIGENVWTETLSGIFGVVQLMRIAQRGTDGFGFVRRANAVRLLRGSVALAALCKIPGLPVGTRIHVPWGMPLHGFDVQFPPQHAWQQQAEAEANERMPGDYARAAQPDYAGGMDVHGVGRDARARQGVRRLYELYPQVDTAQQLAALRAFMREEQRTTAASLRERLGVAQRTAAAAVRERLHLAQRALEDRRLGPYPAIDDPHSTLADGQGGAWPVRDITARIYYATQQLTCAAGNHAELRRERAQAIVGALASCLENKRYRVCQPGQVQRLLMVLQGFVDGIVIDDFALSVASFITMEYTALVHRLGEDFDDEAYRAGFDRLYREGSAHFPRRADRLELESQLKSLAHNSHDFEWEPSR